MSFDNTPTDVKQADKELTFSKSWLDRKRVDYKKALAELERNAEWARDYYDKLDTLDGELLEDYAKGIAAAAIEFIDAHAALQSASREAERALAAYHQAKRRNTL